MISKNTLLYLLLICLVLIGLIVSSGKYNESQLKSGYEERLEKNILQEIIEKTNNENEVLNSSLLGKTVVINVWATWCQPCLKEIPELNQLRQDFAGKEIEFIALDARPASKEKEMMEKKSIKFDYDLYFEQEDLIELLFSYNLKQENNSIPLNIVLNESGKVEFFYSSYNPKKLKEIRAYLDELED